MMKKVIALLLSVTALLCLASCDRNQTKVFEAFNSEQPPVTITTIVDYVYEDAQNADNNIELSAHYKTETQGEKSVFTFYYERLATIEEQLDNGRVMTVDGIIYRDGTQVSTDGAVYEDASALPGAEISIAIERNNFDSYTVSEDGRTLVGKVTGDNIQKTLGVALDANADGVTVELTTNGELVTGLVVTYVSAYGASVSIRTSYTYNPVELVWPQAPAE